MVMAEIQQDRLKSAVTAIIQGQPVHEYQADLLRVAASFVAVEKSPKMQEFLAKCRELNADIAKIDLTQRSAELSPGELMRILEQSVLRRMYFEPLFKGASVPALVQGASIADNRLIFIFALLRASPETFWDELEYFFKWVAWDHVCLRELQRRMGDLKPYVMDFIWFTFSERGWGEDDQKRLRDGVRPPEWRKLAAKIGLHEGDSQELDAMIDFHLARARGAEGQKRIAETALRAMEGKLDFLPNRIRSRLRDEARNQHAQKREPPGEHIEELDDETPDLPQAPATALAEALEGKLRANEKRLNATYGPRALSVLLAFLIGGPRGDQKSIGLITGVSDRTVRTYLRKFAENPQVIRDIVAAP